MLAEIVLPVGVQSVAIRDIPQLFATAIHPALPDTTPRQVKEIKKIPITDKAKREWCGGHSFPVSLNEGDHSKLAQGCWKHLPELRLPLDEMTWQQYAVSFSKAPPPDWELSVLMENPLMNQRVLWCIALEEHTAAIRQAVLNGHLVPRNRATLLPVRHAAGEALLDCFVTVADLKAYAETLNIGLRIKQPPPEFTRLARPVEIDPQLTELADSETVFIHDNIRGGNGLASMSAGAYRAELDATIKRQAEGFFTMDEAAQVLADSRPGNDAKAMIRQMRNAFTSDKLPIRDSENRLPHLDEKEIRDFLSLVKTSDVDAWLDSTGAGYRFPASYDEQYQAAWWDDTLDASSWWSCPSVTPQQAAMLLCRFNPNKETAQDAATITTDKTSPYDYRRLLHMFEGLERATPESRTLAEWNQYAKEKSLKIHPWLDDWITFSKPMSAELTAATAAPSTVTEASPKCAAFREMAQLRANEVSVNFVAGESGGIILNISARRTSKRVALADLDLFDRRKGEPNNQCVLLLAMVDTNKQIQHTTKRAKQISRLRDVFNKHLGVIDDPFDSYRKETGYRPLFSLIDSRGAADERAKREAERKTVSYEQLTENGATNYNPQTYDFDDVDDDETAKWLKNNDPAPKP